MTGKTKQQPKQTTTPRRLYFAYGANTNRKAMHWRCPQATCLTAGVVDDFVLEFRLHADIVEREGASVGGVLWSVTPQDERALDAFEGFPRYYVKRTVRVRTPRGVVQAFAYVMAETVDRGLMSPSPDYWRTLVDGYAENGVDDVQLHLALGRARAASLIEVVRETHELEQLWLEFGDVAS